MRGRETAPLFLSAHFSPAKEAAELSQPRLPGFAASGAGLAHAWARARALPAHAGASGYPPCSARQSAWRPTPQRETEAEGADTTIRCHDPVALPSKSHWTSSGHGDGVGALFTEAGARRGRGWHQEVGPAREWKLAPRLPQRKH